MITAFLRDLFVKFINYSEFRSMLVTELNLKEFAWSEKFIDEFGNCFPKDQKNNYVSYSKALLLFELKQFEKSLNYHELYMQTNDSIFSTEKFNQISKMEAIYDNEKQHKEIELLNKDSELQQTELQNQLPFLVA